MSDYISTRPAPTAHDTAMAVFRPAVYTEAVDWLREFHPDHYAHNPGFRDAVAHLESRRDAVAKAPGAGVLDQVTAAYYLQAAADLRRTGVHEAAARLLESYAGDLNGAQS